MKQSKVSVQDHFPRLYTHRPASTVIDQPVLLGLWPLFECVFCFWRCTVVCYHFMQLKYFKDTYSLPFGWGGPCMQYTALIVVTHIKGWSYLSDYKVINTVWILFRWGQKGGKWIQTSKLLIILRELYEYFDLIISLDSETLLQVHILSPHYHPLEYPTSPHICPPYPGTV